MNHVLVVLDKPSATHFIHPHVANKYPGADVVYVMTAIAGPFAFAYPRGLKMADYPYIGEPKWRVHHEPENSLAFRCADTIIEHKAGEDRSTKRSADIFDAVRSADRIVYAGDRWRTSVVNFDNILDHAFGPERDGMPPIEVYRVQSHHEDHLLGAFQRPGDLRTSWYVKELNNGRLRRLFEYNYQSNSLALIDRELRHVIPEAPSGMISKNTLQLLYHLKSTGGGTEHDILIRMRDWMGTGRYPEAELGTFASRQTILERITDLGLVQKGSGIDPSFVPTTAMKQFLARLHPGCEDPDQPARLNEWAKEWPNSRPKVERYLRTFFGRQKAYASRERHGQ